jgi:hypothetical protein
MRDGPSRVEFSPDATFAASAVWFTNVSGRQVVIDSRGFAPLATSTDAPIYWRVFSKAANGETVADVPPACCN